MVAWCFYNHAVNFMIGPYRDFLHHHPHQDISGGNLVTTGPLEGLHHPPHISRLPGRGAAAPVWLWQLWRFVNPGLHRSERRYARAFIGTAVALFAAGCRHAPSWCSPRRSTG